MTSNSPGTLKFAKVSKRLKLLEVHNGGGVGTTPSANKAYLRNQY